jgi:hypothetical protein
MEKLDPKIHLSDYTEGRSFYTPIMNPLMNNRSKDWYDEIGKIIHSELKDCGIGNLSFYMESIKSLEAESLVMSFLNQGKKKRALQGLAIMFLTDLKPELKTVLDRPLFHSKFGEGFGTKSKTSYASYFVKLGENIFHIGYDHRGTCFEVKLESKSIIDAKYSNEFCESIVESINELVLLIKKS